MRSIRVNTGQCRSIPVSHGYEWLIIQLVMPSSQQNKVSSNHRVKLFSLVVATNSLVSHSFSYDLCGYLHGVLSSLTLKIDGGNCRNPWTDHLWMAVRGFNGTMGSPDRTGPGDPAPPSRAPTALAAVATQPQVVVPWPPGLSHPVFDVKPAIFGGFMRVHSDHSCTSRMMLECWMTWTTWVCP